MKKIFFILISFLILSCNIASQTPKISIESIYSWCIVPFDSLERNPQERIEMLKRLGIKKYGYDWRKKNLPNMAIELTLAKNYNIDVLCVWLWLDDNWDSLEKLNESNEEVLNTIEEVGYKGEIWVSFNANFFEGLSDKAAVKKGAEMIELLSKKANSLGCKIALYNHGDWFGNPNNQIKIIEALPKEDIGLVYNFHHAHKQIDGFSELTTTILPYLWHVNLSGLRKEGPKILPIGEGDHEKQMIDIILKKGYKGDFGILGHVEEKDVELVLKGNLDALKKMYDFN